MFSWSRARVVSNAWTSRSNIAVGDWVCGRCGFLSKRQHKRCLECGQFKLENAETVGFWKCVLCETPNAENVNQCRSCGEIRAREAVGVRLKDLRYISSWTCPYCKSQNFRTSAFCIRCKRFKQSLW